MSTIPSPAPTLPAGVATGPWRSSEFGELGRPSVSAGGLFHSQWRVDGVFEVVALRARVDGCPSLAHRISSLAGNAGSRSCFVDAVVLERRRILSVVHVSSSGEP